MTISPGETYEPHGEDIAPTPEQLSEFIDLGQQLIAKSRNVHHYSDELGDSMVVHYHHDPTIGIDVGIGRGFLWATDAIDIVIKRPVARETNDGIKAENYVTVAYSPSINRTYYREETLSFYNGAMIKSEDDIGIRETIQDDPQAALGLITGSEEIIPEDAEKHEAVLEALLDLTKHPDITSPLTRDHLETALIELRYLVRNPHEEELSYEDSAKLFKAIFADEDNEDNNN